MRSKFENDHRRRIHVYTCLAQTQHWLFGGTWYGGSLQTRKMNGQCDRIFKWKYRPRAALLFENRKQFFGKITRQMLTQTLTDSPGKEEKKSGGAASVHTAVGSNVKRPWVAASVKKNCLKCQNFRITIPSNYCKNLRKISSLKIDR